MSSDRFANNEGYRQHQRNFERVGTDGVGLEIYIGWQMVAASTGDHGRRCPQIRCLPYSNRHKLRWIWKIHVYCDLESSIRGQACTPHSICGEVIDFGWLLRPCSLRILAKPKQDVPVSLYIVQTSRIHDSTNLHIGTRMILLS